MRLIVNCMKGLLNSRICKRSRVDGQGGGGQICKLGIKRHHVYNDSQGEVDRSASWESKDAMFIMIVRGRWTGLQAGNQKTPCL